MFLERFMIFLCGLQTADIFVCPIHKKSGVFFSEI